MKKQLLILVLFMGLFTAASYAQDKKMFAGVDLGFSSVEDVSSSFSIAPSLGYWLSDNMAIVGSVGYNSTNFDATDNTASTFGIGASLRYGWHHGDNTFFYLAPYVSFASSDSGVQGEESTTHFNVGLTPGFDYMMGDRWSINAEIGLLNFTSTSHAGASSSDFSLGLTMSTISLGLWYHF
jgi:outer membrane protein W